MLTVLLCLLLLVPSTFAQAPPSNCDFAATFKNDQFGCYNVQLSGSCGSMTGECPPQFCSHQCADDLLLYYDCSMGNLPACPPSSNSAFPSHGYMAENVLGADEDSFQGYVSAGNGVAYNDRMDQYKKWSEQIAVDAFRAFVLNTTSTYQSNALWTLATRPHSEILAAFYAQPEVKSAVANGIELLPNNYIPDTSAMPITLVGGNSTEKLRGFFDWAKKAAGAVTGAVKKVVGFVANHPDTSWDIGCATWDVFNFFTDGDALACISFKLPDMTQTSKIAAVTPKTKYDPTCLSECNTCLEYAVPGYGDTYCLWDDYKGNWPSDLYCLQGCPSGTTRRLLGSATKDTECYSLCTCGNGLVSC